VGERDDFENEVTYHTLLREDFRRFVDALPKDTHPMPVLSATIGALATFPRSGVSPARWT
jgi:citrate synthase